MSPWTSGILSGILGILIGAFINHRFAIGRERAKECRAVIIPLKQKIYEHINNFDSNPTHKRIIRSDIETIRVYISEYRYKRIIRKWKEYDELMCKSSSTDNYGQEQWCSDFESNIKKKLMELNSAIKK
ncbi:hypothetical protein [Celerinatantimonas diazotrophica]|uniref:Uncharacterized protein n=1 Tax=Celerinatantimonas diazotrophica TaxID=412034 RepID=A0A4R1KDM3_9GAMM|nr:hypothetical protein [Celerinatantimonas diazotrophica]TCK62778.1 hypothetical protein EV690_0447 [Celerinatantimonas diazotrophica]CAG9298409.1 hypothetical protein CEDIAZO_03609 [Celerinatantimonas diazotrophica]